MIHPSGVVTSTQLLGRQWVTIDQAAALMGTSRKAVYWLLRGTDPATGRRLIPGAVKLDHVGRGEPLWRLPLDEVYAAVGRFRDAERGLPDDREWLTIQEAADLVGGSVWTVYTWLRSFDPTTGEPFLPGARKLPAGKGKPSLRVPRDEVLAVAERTRGKGRPRAGTRAGGGTGHIHRRAHAAKTRIHPRQPATPS